MLKKNLEATLPPTVEIQITPSSNFQSLKQNISSPLKPEKGRNVKKSKDLESKKLHKIRQNLEGYQSDKDLNIQNFQKNQLGEMEIKGKIFSVTSRSKNENLESKVQNLIQKQKKENKGREKMPSIYKNQQFEWQISPENNRQDKIANFSLYSQNSVDFFKSNQILSSFQISDQSRFSKENDTLQQLHQSDLTKPKKKQIEKYSESYFQRNLQLDFFKKNIKIYTQPQNTDRQTQFDEMYFQDLIDSQRDFREKFKNNAQFLSNMKHALTALNKLEIVYRNLILSVSFENGRDKNFILESLLEVEKQMIIGFKKLQKRDTVVVEKENEVNKTLVKENKNLKKDKNQIVASKNDIKQELEEYKKVNEQ